MAKIVVKTVADNKQLEKDLNESKRMLERYDKEAKKLTNQKLKITSSDEYKEYRSRLNSLAEDYNATMNSFKKQKILTPDLESKTNTRFQGYLNDLNNEYSKLIQNLTNVDTKLNENKKTRDSLNKSIDNTINKIEQLRQQQLQDDVNKINNNIGKITDNIGKMGSKGVSSIKRIALSLFGVQSALTVVRRASSTYLSQHEGTARKMQSIWIALGNIIGPVLEMLADLVLKLVGYLNVFIGTLSNGSIDITKNMDKATNSINKTTDAQKKLNRELYSFDEINKQQDDTSTSSSSSSALAPFEMPELNQGIVTFLKDMATVLRDNWELIKNVGIALGIVFGAYEIGKLIKNIGMLLGGGAGATATGLIGLASVLSVLAGMEAIAIGITVVYGVEEQKKLSNIKNDLINATKKTREEQNKLFDDEMKYYQETGKEANKHISLKNQIRNSIELQRGSIKLANEAVEKDMTLTGRIMGFFDNITTKISGTIPLYERNLDYLEEQKISLAMLTKQYWGLYKAGMITFEDFIEAFPELNGLISKSGELTDDILKKAFELREEVVLQGQTANEQIDSVEENLNELNGVEAKPTIIVEDEEAGISIKTTKDKLDEVNNMTPMPKISPQTKEATNILEFVHGLLDNLNGYTAKSKVEIQPKTDSLRNVFSALSDIPIIGGVTSNVFKTAYNALKRIGFKEGGIFNLPGKGVSVSNVAIGEATGGAEGAVPLSNKQAMETIGETIAKYIPIQIVNYTMLDNRVIAKEQKTVSNNISFNKNGRA